MTKNVPALLFSAATGGVSGWQVHFALLRRGEGDVIRDDFSLGPMTFSNQNRHALLSDPEISSALIFVAADYILGMDEAHYSPHRYIILAYVRKLPLDLDEPFYYLEDQYMTARKYDGARGPDILASEKHEILARLKRVKADIEHQTSAQR